MNRQPEQSAPPSYQGSCPHGISTSTSGSRFTNGPRSKCGNPSGYRAYDIIGRTTQGCHGCLARSVCWLHDRPWCWRRQCGQLWLSNIWLSRERRGICSGWICRWPRSLKRLVGGRRLSRWRPGRHECYPASFVGSRSCPARPPWRGVLHHHNGAETLQEDQRRITSGSAWPASSTRDTAVRSGSVAHHS